MKKLHTDEPIMEFNMEHVDKSEELDNTIISDIVEPEEVEGWHESINEVEEN